MLYCWKCGKATGIVGRPARSDDCRYCQAELRSCRGCRFFDTTKSGQCAESRAEPPTDKEQVNFCDYFVAGEFEKVGHVATPSRGSNSVEQARKALDSLFK
jgi:hypothetical protein